MLVILSFRKKGQCRPTRAQLMERSGMAVNTLYARMAELRAAGLLATYELRDERGRIRAMLIPFPPTPQTTGPCRKLWDKDHVAKTATRKSRFTHARARQDHNVTETYAKNGNGEHGQE